MTDHRDALVLRGGHGAVADLGGPVYHMDFGGPLDGPNVVLVHGLGGSHLDWVLAAPGLTERARVWAVDLPGFGRSEPCGRSSTVRANAAVLDRFVREVVGVPVVLVGNSMGGMISILVAARSPDAVSGLVLVDPALPPPRSRRIDLAVLLRFALFALPGIASYSIAHRRQRLGIRAAVAQNLRGCGLDLNEVPAAVLDQRAALVECRRDPAGMDRAFVEAARSLLTLTADPRRYRATMDEVEVPVLLLHGGKDRLVPVEAARDAARRHPRWQTVIWPDAGHLPQVQMPDRFTRLIRSWLDPVAARTAAPADPVKNDP